jgi:preprotein translocase subunit SecG
MKSFFNILTVVSVVVMTTAILLQSRGTGLSTTFGGEGNVYRTKRGAEKIVFNATIVAAVVFVLSVILSILSRG